MEDIATAAAQYLTFTLGGEQYALEVVHAREVLPDRPLTVIPRMPAHMKGIINIRGRVVPVVDLRTKFGMEEGDATSERSIIVVEISSPSGTERVVLGCRADSVQEVVEIDEETVEPPPAFGSSVDVRFIRGIGKRDGIFVILLDIDELFRDDEIARLEPVEPVA
ncbi:MAG: chemotaxis protein CheW [Alkalispirochaeta sp.]